MSSRLFLSRAFSGTRALRSASKNKEEKELMISIQGAIQRAIERRTGVSIDDQNEVATAASEVVKKHTKEENIVEIKKKLRGATETEPVKLSKDFFKKMFKNSE